MIIKITLHNENSTFISLRTVFLSKKIAHKRRELWAAF